ncbi:hypothetical protein GH714_029220 [Hevea brasiliensis]|uniref:Peptidase S8/S53 domain-containing protein n=1 Tax=Hevea brasiliensis TaxID=3981 RepID=A0A6A6LFQ9_HEVBR|nr:hypothetical protein GH714_029220 [Hevea brasiliensis]
MEGKCEFKGTACDNKLIGARNVIFAGEHPLLDQVGHGTHTASTAAGSPVQGANFHGQANGTAYGIAPLAHLAIYKVCEKVEGCSEAGILTAKDSAVEDGVDVLSISLAGDPVPFFNDPIAIAAIKKGIFVSCSAGNSGPDQSSLFNEAPWILTVGASTLDREIRATVLLGNNSKFDARCEPRSLRNADVKGKIVLCDRGGAIETETIDKGQEVKDSRGVAMILMNDESGGYVTRADAYVLPASHMLLSLLPFPQEVPSTVSPGILKPDVIGPGERILAAWPVSKFEMMSGTSMSCPHLSGFVALLRSAHPDWSPAAIKSAIVTTARLSNLAGKPISDRKFVPVNVFGIGAAHVNPSEANNPGLVYDIQPDVFLTCVVWVILTNRLDLLCSIL